MTSEPIFADTNLFLRLLTNDIPEQADAFERLLRKASSGEVQLITNQMVMAEIVWTLESYYGLSKGSVQEKILAILNTPGLAIVGGDLVLQAILWYVEKNVDFIDAYNTAWMLEQGITRACTFDKKHFSRIEGITPFLPS